MTGEVDFVKLMLDEMKGGIGTIFRPPFKRLRKSSKIITRNRSDGFEKIRIEKQMQNNNEKIKEDRLQFVARKYREGALNTDRAWKKLAIQKGLESPFPFRQILLASAALLFLLLGIGVFFVNDRSREQWVAVSTSSGEVKEVILPDGTQVAMAENSVLRYEMKGFGKEARVVKMSGKMFFQVEGDEMRPFSVRTTHTEITVLGTSFQVNEKTLNTEVNVMTGKVRFVAGDSGSVTLTAGMSGAYSPEKKKIILLSEEDLNTLAWRTKLLQFKNTPVEKVIEDLCAYYRVRIFNKEDARGKKLTATFHDLPLDEVLMVINQTLDIRLTSEKR